MVRKDHWEYPQHFDRTIQQAIAQPISDIYEEIFSDYSYGFRAGRSCHDAIRQALEYLNDGYEWVVDIDIEQFFRQGKSRQINSDTKRTSK